MALVSKRIGVIGVGSAGVLTLSYLCSNMSNEWEVVSIHDPSIPILGIGESTNPGFISILEQGTQFNLLQDTDKLDSTFKFGTMYVGFRDTDWLNPLIHGSVAVHFNNFKLKEFVFERLAKFWPKKFRVIEGKVTDVINTPIMASVVVNGTQEDFDYVVDCRGFPTDYTDYTKSTCTLLNHCLVHSFDKFDPIQYTEHIATKNGWMFGIPLTNRKTYGYLFNNTITTLDDAKANMAEHLNITVDELDLKEYQFNPYYCNKVVDGRVIKNGNRAIFFEPISATSINQYTNTCSIIFKYITGQSTQEESNIEYVRLAQTIENVINYIYHGGSKYDSEFWRQAAANSKKNLSTNNEFRKIMAYSQRATDMGLPYNGPPMLFSGYNLSMMDEFLGYNYFKGYPFLFDLNDDFNSQSS
jgi:tryptophan halogenase